MSISVFLADDHQVMRDGLRTLIEAQPGHLQHAQKGEFEPGQRDLLRAARLRSEFANFGKPDFNFTNGKN